MKKIGKIYKGIIFFLDEFHHGAANHVIHFAGFTLLGYGLATQNLFIVMLSPLVMEAGHIYNYSRGKHRHLGIKIIPLQIAAGLLFAGIAYVLIGVFA